VKQLCVAFGLRFSLSRRIFDIACDRQVRRKHVQGDVVGRLLLFLYCAVPARKTWGGFDTKNRFGGERLSPQVMGPALNREFELAATAGLLQIQLGYFYPTFFADGVLKLTNARKFEITEFVNFAHSLDA
jgi:hypothetical protein